MLCELLTNLSPGFAPGIRSSRRESVQRKNECAIPQSIGNLGGSGDVLPATSLLRPHWKLITRGTKSVLCEVIFSSKQAGKVDGFLYRHEIAIVSTTKLNSAGPQFPVVMSSVVPPVKYLHCLITANRSEREQKQLGSISLPRNSLYRFTNRFPIRDFFSQGRGCGLLI
jgi:hypothetical protein